MGNNRGDGYILNRHTKRRSKIVAACLSPKVMASGNNHIGKVDGLFIRKSSKNFSCAPDGTEQPDRVSSVSHRLSFFHLTMETKHKNVITKIESVKATSVLDSTPMRHCQFNT